MNIALEFYCDSINGKENTSTVSQFAQLLRQQKFEPKDIDEQVIYS
jgi:hypothetical protein